MSANISQEALRTELDKILKGVDLASTSIGKLRAGLEQALGLKAGQLDSRKQEVNSLVSEYLSRQETSSKESASKNAAAASGEKRKAAKPAAGAPAKAPKKALAKKEEPSEDEALEAEKLPEAPPPAAEPPPPPAPEPEPPQDPFGSGEALDPFFAPFDAEEEPASTRQRAWAVSGGEDGQLRLWDIEAYTCARVMEGHTGAIRSLAVDWKDMLALSGADDNVRLWSLRHGSCQKTFSEVEEGCGAVAASWEGTKAYGGCGDGQLKTWDMTTGELLTSIAAHPGGVWVLDFDAKRERLASGGDEHFKVWDVKNWTCLFLLEGHPGGIMSLTMDWERLRALIGVGSSELSLRLWDIADKLPTNLIGHRDAAATNRADWGVGIAVSGGWDAELRVWNIKQGSCRNTHECHFGRIRSLTVDFVQMQAICGSSRGSLHFVDLHGGSELRVLEGHIGGVTAVEARRP